VLRSARGTVRVATMPVPAPGPVTARATDGVISLAWTPPRFAGATDDIVVAYVVERADSAGAFIRITDLPVMRLADQPSAHQDDAAVPGRLYRYRVRAADLLGRLSEAGPAVAIRAPDQRGPLPPPQVASEVTDGRIRLVWTVSPEPRTRGYQVERSIGGDSTYTRISRTLVDGETPEFIDTLVRGRQVYSYRVRAVDDAGRVGAPSNPTTTRGLDQRPPAAPAELTATVLSGHRVRLAWRAVPDRDVRGYEVHRTEQGDTLFSRLTGVPIRATVYVDSGYDGATLEPGREYVWRIMAVDSSGNVSPPAERRLRLVDDEAPEPVRSVLVHNQQGRHVEISWSGSQSLDVARYLVERVGGGAIVAGAAPAGATATLIATVPSRGTFFVRDTTAVKGRVAQWRVVAVDSAGNRAEPLGDTLTFRDLTRPPAPRRATAIREAGVTTVRWERVVSSDLRGYVVYRAERSDGPRTKLTATPLTALEFVDRAAPPGARYVVRAVDASGNESDESPVAAVVERP
jgi:fibronectin type 3 domain-containing protein